MSIPILLPYQQRWLADKSKVRVVEKSRRIGFTFATALQCVLKAAGSGPNQFYIGYNNELAEEFIQNCGFWSDALNLAFESEFGSSLYEDYEDDYRRAVLTKKIRFPSGYRIQALTSHPRNLRGKQGDIIIDEAAFHDDLPGLLKAAKPALIWGSRLAVMSTHNGVNNAFNQLVKDIKSQKKKYSLHRVTFEDAMREGLYEQIAHVNGLPLTDEAKNAWYHEILEDVGEDADEELFCIPGKSSGVYLLPSLVERAMRQEYRVIRFEVEDGFALYEETHRENVVRQWYEQNVYPFIEKLDKKKTHYVGQDFGRKADISAIAIGSWSQRVTLEVPLVVEIQNIPFEQQKSIMTRLLSDLPNFTRACVDATGNGSYLAEVLMQRFGPTIIESVSINEKWYSENLPVFRSRFEDGLIGIPRDFDIMDDLLLFQYIDGIPKMPKIRKDSKASTHKRHGDSGIALALMESAARPDDRMYAYEKVDRGGTFGSSGSIW